MNSAIVSIGFGLNEAGLTLIPATVGEFGLCFIVDSGASVSLLDSSVIDQLGDLVERQDKQSFILGIDGKYKEAQRSAILTFNIDSHSFTHQFISESLFMSFAQIELESNIQIHGILGNDFLVKNKWIIDYGKLEIRQNV